MFRRALPAPAEHGEVRAVQDESVLGEQVLCQRLDERRIGVGHRATGVADDVDVIVLGRSVRGCTVPEVCMSNEPDLLQQFERPIDGGDVDTVDRFADLLGRCVAERAHGVQYLLALRSHPKPESAQPCGELAGRRRTRMCSLMHGHHPHGR